MQEQLQSDNQYKEMFGGDSLVIKRQFKIRKAVLQEGKQPIIPQIMNVSSQNEIFLEEGVIE